MNSIEEFGADFAVQPGAVSGLGFSRQNPNPSPENLIAFKPLPQEPQPQTNLSHASATRSFFAQHWEKN